jgi:DNA-binding MarR family transcriptional regulator
MNTHANSSFAYQLHDAMRLFRKHFDRRAQRFGLTRAQWLVLKATHREEGLSQKELAEYIDMEPIAVGRVVDRLEQAGFIERRADPADRRRWRLYLTSKAHAVTDDMEIVAQELRVESLRGIDQADFDAFIRALTRIRENLGALDSPVAPPNS